jgi:hypothetical protein
VDQLIVMFSFDVLLILFEKSGDGISVGIIVMNFVVWIEIGDCLFTR